MNDKDKEAYEKYLIKNNVNQRQIWNELSLDEIWQAACDYMQAEIAHHIFKIEAENARLIECVEFYASTGAQNDDHDFFILKDYKFSIPTTRRARQVLKELDEKL